MSDVCNLTELGKVLADLDEDKVNELVERYLSVQAEPLSIIDELSTGMDEVGRRFRDEEYFLSELVYSGEIFKNAMARLRPLIKAGDGHSSKGTVVMGTVKEDIHDLGKNIVGTMLECAGFTVVDIGVDAPAEKFVSAIRESGARLVGMSVLLTTAFNSMKNIIAAIEDAELRSSVSIMIGGSVTSEKIRGDMGADYHGSSAADAVDIARKIYIGATGVNK
jgi:methanogenic corrinoid protein MtbC1